MREAFVQLYERGLIYRGHRVIHWCPRCLTSLSDEEAEHHDENGAMYHIAYPLEGDPSRSIVIATTRPETMLADVAVAVHPDDERYADLVGKNVVLPIVNRPIPIIADEYVDREFGTGALKITPAHDANDFEVGMRHKLAMPVVIDAEGRMAEEADADGRVPAELKGMDRFDARKRIAKMLQQSGALVKTESRTIALRRCYRCDTVVEPRLSDQWFVKMKPLAEPALAGVRSGRTRVLPERWEAVYINWLEGIRDWNISRQLWWGHRVPIWYDKDGGMHALREDPSPAEVARLGLRQDEDVLDTWFSSWLWPISTLGWPNEESPDLKAFYPTDVLVTAPEILFFWVARMIMAGYAFTGDAPFHTVYLHGTVRDMQHRKMSKSLGNGIDPLDVVEKYGADALRWTVIAGMGMGADVMLDPNDLEKSFAPGRNFVTKLWNIGRFLLQNIGDKTPPALANIDPKRCRPRTPGFSAGSMPRSRNATPRSVARVPRPAIGRATSAFADCASTNTPKPRDALRGTNSPTGTSKHRSRVSRVRAPTAMSRAACSCTCSIRRCACCIPSYRSSPKHCGSGCRGAPRAHFSRRHRGPPRGMPNKTAPANSNGSARLSPAFARFAASTTCRPRRSFPVRSWA